MMPSRRRSAHGNFRRKRRRQEHAPWFHGAAQFSRRDRSSPSSANATARCATFWKISLAPGRQQTLSSRCCATSDRPAPLRVRACFVALTIAEYFRDQGKSVLLVIDSVTRLAMAQREIGLAAGEPPVRRAIRLRSSISAKGAGTRRQFRNGSITGFFTVLVEGDDFNEPICDSVRSILDGHIVLSRRIAAGGHYPAVDVLQSLSRLTSYRFQLLRSYRRQ